MDPELERQKLIAAQLRAKQPTATLDPTCLWDPSLDATARTALSRAPDTSFETGGVLYKNSAGEYCYSIPVGNDRSATINFQAKVPKGLSLAGLYHTHPDDKGEKEAEFFSPNDVATAGELKMPSYIRVLKSGAVKRYVPGSSQLEIMPYAGKAVGLRVSRGEDVSENGRTGQSE